MVASLVVLSAPAVPAHAQDAPPDTVVLHGRVIDAASRTPVSGAFVTDQASGEGALTDESGGFRLAVPSAEVHHLHVGGFGYQNMAFQLGAEQREQLLILPVQPLPFAMEELTVEVEGLTRLERRLERRVRSYRSAVRSFGVEQIENYGDGTAWDLLRRTGAGVFECWDTPGGVCTLGSARSARSPGGVGGRREQTVLVCLDDRRLWGGVAELESYPVRELYRLELYGFRGRDQIRLYTRWYMVRNAQGEKSFPPAEFGC